MEFWVKLIEVLDTSDGEARNDLQANCTHVSGDYWLFEGDEEALHEGIKFQIAGEEAIEAYGDLSKDQVKKMVIETYGIDPCFL